MNYKTFQPSSNLKPLIKCYWTLESPKEDFPLRQTIVPDGCIEMIFHYGDLFKQYIEKNISIIQPRCFVIGQLTQPLEIEPTGETGIFSVRFHPQGFLPFTPIPLKELENKAISLKSLFGQEGKELADNMIQSYSTQQRIVLIETFLLSRVADTDAIDRIVQSTIDTLLTANGQLSIDAISRENYIHRRNLERKFSTAIGLSPKQLAKTIRLQDTLKMLLNQKFTSLTSLSYEGGYYDQSHFIKDFKEFTGLTPSEFYSEHLQFSKLFYES
ncbi:MAG TPA: helix-turn-helix domain-containing protein [Saprospiraceae bacterium]|nr:helix-turn-helix domain-containing protein [Saprospiraceae bacterium]